MKKQVFAAFLIVSVIVAVSFAKTALHPNNSRLKTQLEALQKACDIDQDSLYEHLKDFEQAAISEPDTVRQAVMQMALARLYADYYAARSFEIDDRTDFINETPNDIREWTRLHFKQRIQHLIAQSLRYQQTLLKTPIGQYRDCFETNKDSLLRPTAYDVLVYEAVGLCEEDSAQVLLLYSDLINAHTNEPLPRDAARLERDAYRFHQSLNWQAQQYQNSDLYVYVRYRQLLECDSTPLYKHLQCEQLVRQYPQNPYLCCIRYLMQQLETSSIALSHIASSSSQGMLHTDCNYLLYPGIDEYFNIEYTNVNKADVRVYRINATAADFANLRYQAWAKIPKKQLLHYTYKLDSTLTYSAKQFGFSLNMPECGIYAVVVEGNGHKTTNPQPAYFVVSKWGVYDRVVSSNKHAYYIADRYTGCPEKGVACCFGQRNQKMDTLYTNVDGLVEIPLVGGGVRVSFKKGTDGYFPVQTEYGYKQDRSVRTQQHSAFFLDRKIFRPGQTLQAKGVVYQNNGTKYSLCPHTVCEVSCHDANGKLIEKQKVQTNAMGSFVLRFNLPTNRLPGNYSLQTNGGYCQFKVEEYKRPTFEVQIDSLQATTLSDTVCVKGHAAYLRGLTLNKAAVSYKVTATPVLFWACFPQRRVVVATGKTQTAADGTFQLNYLASDALNVAPFCRLETEVSVTDAAGETQTVNRYLTLGKSAYAVYCNLQGNVNKDSLSQVLPEVLDAAGNKIQIKGRYLLCGGSNYQDTLAASFFESNQTLPIDWQHLASGAYRLVLSVADKAGKLCEQDCCFVLYSLNDPKPPLSTIQWVVPQKDLCANGEEAVFILGSSSPDTYTLVQWFDGTQLISSKVYCLQAQNIRISMRYDSLYKDALSLQVLTIRRGELRSSQFMVRRQLKSRRLNVEFSPSSSTYAPLATDTWQLKVSDAEGKPVDGELSLVLYDQSLDAFAPNSWHFEPVISTVESSSQWTSVYLQQLYCSYQWGAEKYREYQFKYPSIRWYSYTGCLSYGRFYGFARPMMAKAAVNRMNKGEGVDELETMATRQDLAEEASVPTPEPTETLRSSFEETALFLPQLSLRQGRCELPFTAPQALTRWKLLVMAHTDSLQTGVCEAELLTQKALSVNTHLPRFVRMGDRSVFAASIDNLQDQTDTLLVSWVILDAVSGKTLLDSAQHLVVAARSQKVCYNPIKIPNNLSLLELRLNVKGRTASDGIKQVLPVLSAQELLTQTMPVALYQPGSYQYQFQAVKQQHSTTLCSRNFVVEITPDAAVWVLQALPFYQMPRYDNVVEYAVSYYVNYMALRVLEARPALKKYLLDLSADSTLAVSALERQPELKQLLLQETPWIVDGENETACMRALAYLVDTAKVNASQQQLLSKIYHLQQLDGGFAWFEGGKSSVYITQCVLDLLYRSGIATVQTNRAAAFLQKQLKLDYERYGQPNLCDLQTLWLLKSYRTEAALAYYKWLKSNWKKLNIPMQAWCARLFFAHNDARLAKEVLKHVREFAVYKEGMGLYWPNSSTISTQSLYVQAFSEIAPNPNELAQMKLWLLYNKQANLWPNALATSDAIGALVFAGPTVSDSASVTRLVVDGVTMSSDDGVWSGTLRYAVSDSAVNNVSGNFTIQKQGHSLSLGAAYWQYTEDVDKVLAAQDKRLNVEKTYYKEVEGSLCAINLNDVRVGDRIVVRLVVRADRDMEYIHLRDMRPAGLEPVKQLSSCRVQSGLVFYQSMRDVVCDFFFDYLPKGTYVFEYQLNASQAGTYAAGYATIESMYSPDFKSHSAGLQMQIKP